MMNAANGSNAYGNDAHGNYVGGAAFGNTLGNSSIATADVLSNFLPVAMTAMAVQERQCIFDGQCCHYEIVETLQVR
ncbi:MAG TPA: hypothetical protein DCL15_12150 [Chloroflexi bacterium]|nr:hypothetical protein [Chloroflexota bacterium]HHW87415.1 hypothetical protein [Chloroflexota bacterium]